MSSPEWIISPKELLAEKAGCLLLDVREPQEHALCSIAGSKLIPLREVEARGPAELDREREIVVYCHHGMRSMQALMILKQLGFEKVRSLDGGIDAWAEECEPGMKRY